jgi:hypothetical protein
MASSRRRTTALRRRAEGGSDVKIRNLTIQNIYVHTSSSDTISNDTSGIDLRQVNNASIHDLTIHDSRYGIFMAQDTNQTNVEIYNNDIYNIDGGIIPGSHAAVMVSDLKIHGNHIHDYANWDTMNCTYHNDGIHIWDVVSPTGAIFKNLMIYNNTFDGNMGDCLNAHIFLQEANFPGARIFNNIFAISNRPAGGGGLVSFRPKTSGTSDIALYNNTFYCAAVNSGPRAVYVSANVNSYVMKNNVIVNCRQLVLLQQGSFAANGLNNNIYVGCTGTCWAVGSSFYSTLASWKAATSQDANAKHTSGSAGLDSKYRPQVGSIAIGAGANLTSLSIAALSSDKARVARPATGAWDIGAYVFNGGRPAPPTGLRVQ